MIISLVSNIGGVGRTTLALSLAHELSQQGYKVLLCDHSPQQCAYNFTQMLDKSFDIISLMDNLVSLRTFEQVYDIILIDTTRASDYRKDFLNVVKVTDYFVILTKACSFDFERNKLLIDFLKENSVAFNKNHYKVLFSMHDHIFEENMIEELVTLRKEIRQQNLKIFKTKFHYDDLFWKMVVENKIRSHKDTKRIIKEIFLDFLP